MDSVKREELERVKEDLGKLDTKFEITINKLITNMDSMNTALTHISECMEIMKNKTPSNSDLELKLISNREHCQEQMKKIAVEVIQNEMGKWSLKMVIKLASVIFIGAVLTYLGLK